MTREEQIERVREVLGPPPFAFVDEQGLAMWAERIVDALAQPDEERKPTPTDQAETAIHLTASNPGVT